MENNLVDRLRMVFDEVAEIYNAALAGDVGSRCIDPTEAQRRVNANFKRVKAMAFVMLHAASAQAAVDKANATNEEVPHDSCTH